jgi:hypothetical protein
VRDLGRKHLGCCGLIEVVGSRGDAKPQAISVSKMGVGVGLLIGMDEAGYGPNLGPLVVTVTAWDVPGNPREFDLAEAMSDVVESSPTRGGNRLHIADSKQVYSPSRGIASLERSVVCALKMCGLQPKTFCELRETLSPPEHDCSDLEHWLDGPHLQLPTVENAKPTDEMTARWSECCQQNGIRLRAIRSDVVLTRRFNDLTKQYGSKGLTLSRISLKLLRSVWNPDDDQPTFIVADKHGGRNRYDDLLAETLDEGHMIFRGIESTARSDYRIGATDIRFQAKAESHLPVALASMVSKYVRELAMMRFNHFWQSHQPDLKPTKGYPVDARRFKNDIAETQAALGIDDTDLWRDR